MCKRCIEIGRKWILLRKEESLQKRKRFDFRYWCMRDCMAKLFKYIRILKKMERRNRGGQKYGNLCEDCWDFTDH